MEGVPQLIYVVCATEKWRMSKLHTESRLAFDPCTRMLNVASLVLKLAQETGFQTLIRTKTTKSTRNAYICKRPWAVICCSEEKYEYSELFQCLNLSWLLYFTGPGFFERQLKLVTQD